jgi:hypothetical protein
VSANADPSGHKKSQSLSLLPLPNQSPSQKLQKRLHQLPKRKRSQPRKPLKHSATHQPLKKSRNRPPHCPRLNERSRRPLLRPTSFWLQKNPHSQSRQKNSKTQQLPDLEGLAPCPHGLSKNSRLPSPVHPNPSRPTLVPLDSDHHPLPRDPLPRYRHRLPLSLGPTRGQLSDSRKPTAKVSFFPLPSIRASATWRCSLALSALVV